MRQDGFPVQDLDDGWAIMAYDAVATVATALAAQSTTPGQIQSALQDNDLKVPGADGTFTFDANGNRSGPGPALVRLCPAASGYQTITVVVRPGKSTSC
jgi:ABC-type branched-subunit amino acid transport system substrate-binding protein